MERLLVPFFLVLGLVQCSFSQSEFLHRGQSGFSGGIGIMTDREKNGWNFSAGYSYRGFIDANLTYTKANGGRVQGGVLSPTVRYYLSKQEDAERMPTLGISLGFSRYDSKTAKTIIVPDTVVVSWQSYERVTEQTINALNLGVTGQSRTGYWKVFFFQPFLGAEVSVTNAGSEFKLCGGVSIGSRVVRGPLIIFTPRIERQSGLTTLMLAFGAVF